MKYNWQISRTVITGQVRAASLHAHGDAFILRENHIRECNMKPYPVDAAYKMLRQAFRKNHYDYILLSNRR